MNTIIRRCIKRIRVLEKSISNDEDVSYFQRVYALINERDNLSKYLKVKFEIVRLSHE